MIYIAKITVEIKRAYGKHTKTLKGREPVVEYKYEKETKTIEMIYQDGHEKNKNSWFISCLEREIGINLDKKEDYKITNIEKIKKTGINADYE